MQRLHVVVGRITLAIGPTVQHHVSPLAHSKAEDHQPHSSLRHTRSPGALIAANFSKATNTAPKDPPH
jgi:hypothetical protein